MSDLLSFFVSADGYTLLFQVLLLTFLSGTIAPLPFKDGKKAAVVSAVPAMVGSLVAVTLGTFVILAGPEFELNLPTGTVDQLSMQFRIDGIAAFFMIIIGLVSFTVSIYSIGYSAHYNGKRSIRALGFLLNLFVLSMVLVIASDNVFSFLVFWETMSLASFFLVIYDHDNEANIKSGLMYIVMTHLGTAFIMGSFLLLYFQTGSLSFDSFRSPSSAFPSQIKDIVFVLALVGFGTKAGMVPLHIWLPEAHPSAPSNISALMSAVMIKMAVYGLLRVILDFSSPSSSDSAWWGLVMVAVGSVSAVIGVLYAAIEKDIKRALAYSSIENMGIIIIGIGLSVVFLSYNLKGLASFALFASMMHTLTHASFKSLLFMGAGSVVSRTHTRNMEELGGLVKKMPLTAFLFLLGAMAGSGLPPLNGFVSEWLTMQALLSSYQLPNTLLQISISFASIAFALTVGIALAAFVKIFGISFLAKCRSEKAEQAKEVPRSMVAGMTIAASLCIIFGIIPYLGTGLVAGAFHIDSSQFTLSASPFQTLSSPQEAGAHLASMSTQTVAVMIGSAAAGLIGFMAFAGGGKKRIQNTWDCGFGQLNERMEYNATSISQPIRTIFKSLYKAQTIVKKDHYSDTNPYLKKSIRAESHAMDLFFERLYRPITWAAVSFFDKIRMIQTGNVNAYILYIMVALVTLLVLARLVP